MEGEIRARSGGKRRQRTPGGGIEGGTRGGEEQNQQVNAGGPLVGNVPAQIAEMNKKMAQDAHHYQMVIASLRKTIYETAEGKRGQAQAAEVGNTVRQAEVEILKKQISGLEAKCIQIKMEKEMYVKQIGEERNSTQMEIKTLQNKIKAEEAKWEEKLFTEIDTDGGDGEERSIVTRLRAELAEQKMKARKYKSEMHVKTIGMKAQLEIQKFQLEEKEEDLETQKKIGQKALQELKRIRAGDGNANSSSSPKKRKLYQ